MDRSQTVTKSLRRRCATTPRPSPDAGRGQAHLQAWPRPPLERRSQVNASSEQAVWFQYRPGVVVESLRVAHCAAPTSTNTVVQSWCRLKFDPANLELAASPGEPATSEKAPACAPCAACLLRLTAETDANTGPTTHASDACDDTRLAVILRKAQWLLDDAAHYLPQGNYDQRERDALAATLDQLAGLIREQAPERRNATEQPRTQTQL